MEHIFSELSFLCFISARTFDLKKRVLRRHFAFNWERVYVESIFSIENIFSLSSWILRLNVYIFCKKKHGTKAKRSNGPRAEKSTFSWLYISSGFKGIHCLELKSERGKLVTVNQGKERRELQIFTTETWLKLKQSV